MPKNIIETLQRNSFWLSLFLHGMLLIYLFWGLKLQHRAKPHELPTLAIPAYPYQANAEVFSVTQKMEKEMKQDSNGLLKPVKREKAFSPANPITQKASKRTEAINLVGDKEIRKPLLEIIGKALAHTLFYPKIASDFNIHGIAYVGFELQPNGKLSNIRLLQSSGAVVLDEAALKGVAAVTPLNKVDQFLKEKKMIAIGIIFK